MGENRIISSGFTCLVLLCFPVPLEKKDVFSVNWKHRLSFSLLFQKATKKTDKPRPEEKDGLDITEMSNEDLQEQLMKYGVNPGPIVGRSIELADTNLFYFSLCLTCEVTWYSYFL